MKLLALFLSINATIVFLSGCNQQKITDALKSVLEREVSEEEITEALKDALKLGVRESVTTLGKENGFYKSEEFKIEMPEGNGKLVELFLEVGGQKKIDAFILSMNRSAEKAIPETLDIFIKAIVNMSVNDAKNILMGGENSATLYFKENTESALISVITPVIKKAMEEANVETTYKILHETYLQLDSLLSKNETVNTILSFFSEVTKIEKPKMLTYNEVIEHVLHKSLFALFKTVENREIKIREDVRERTTELLQRVFKLYDEEKIKKSIKGSSVSIN
jgi:hypothetical protein